jgi:hypothetical protein
MSNYSDIIDQQFDTGEQLLVSGGSYVEVLALDLHKWGVRNKVNIEPLIVGTATKLKIELASHLTGTRFVIATRDTIVGPTNDFNAMVGPLGPLHNVLYSSVADPLAATAAIAIAVQGEAELIVSMATTNSGVIVRCRGSAY